MTMRNRLRTAILAAGAGWSLFVIVLAIAAAMGSWVVAVIAAVLGLVLVVATCVVVMRLATRLSGTTDRLATRAKNLEKRAEVVEQQADALEQGVDEVGSRVVDVEVLSADHDRRIVETASSVAGLDTGLAATTRSLGDLDERSARQDATQKELVESLDARFLAGDEEAASLRTAIAHTRGAQKRSVDRVEAVRKDLRVLRARVPSGFLAPLEGEVSTLKARSKEVARTSFETAIQLGRTPSFVLSPASARKLFADYISQGDYLRVRPLLDSFDLLAEQNLTTSRAIYRYFRATGYWELAAKAVAQVHEKSGRENDAKAVAKIQHEISLFSQPLLVNPELPDGDAHDPSGPILHMVGRVLPETQTGYTLRTQYTALAQIRKGLPVAIVGQSGITENDVEQTEHYVHGGVDYYLLPGAARNQLLLDEWLAENIRGLAQLVLEVRPSVLHAQSDFFNALIVHAVGTKYSIPTVYESRGFWEESWLSRTIDANGWGDGSDIVFSMYGLPDAYTLRKRAEEIARQLPDHVFTLAEVMRDHIIDSAKGQIPGDSVSIVPNAVEATNFPVQESDRNLAEEIGLPEGALVVGYISSIVEYEGIDTLIDGYRLAAATSDRPLCLLLVGDGAYLPTLRERVESAGIENVFFTGRVPHEDVLRYYGLIDLFVVPRKASAVADLVTPLKPFEAFSTGRTVILSDVGALQEIARQSGAVETFRAGDSTDLSRKLLELIQDPERRQELGRTASRWVRNYRTWDSNVSEYYRVYKKLGYTGPSSLNLEAEVRLRERGVNAGDLLDVFEQLPEPPLTGWFSLSEMKQDAHDIVATGWTFEEFEPVRVTEHPEWAAVGEANRTWGFNLHTWTFMEPLLREHSRTGDRYWLETSLDIAMDWIGTYLDPEAPEDPMAWYDMALALRAPMLLNLLIRTARHEDLQPQATVLIDAILRHMDELLEERAFNPNNNHGFYTAASQLHLAKHGSPLPGAGTLHDDGAARLRTMADRQFAPDGAHLEHSPDYHRMLLGSFERAVQDGLVDDEDIRERIGRAAEVLGWMVQPDGYLVQFGDTPATYMTVDGATSIDPHTQYILSDGRRGEAPGKELAVYRDGGYAFVRSPAPQAPGDLAASGYLAFSAAFHSRAHKHADDLNLVWYDRGTEILVDSGRYGYGGLLPADSPLRKKGFYYGSPERQYVEGTRAHNTVEMDGEDQDRRNRAPYGSGIADAVQTDGVFDLSARVHHADYIHRRRVVYTPGRQLLVKDAIFSQSPDSRSAVVWYNIDGAFELVERGESLVFERLVNGDPVRLEVSGPGTLVDPVRGGQDPLRGWRSRQDRSLEPVWSIGFSVAVETRAAVDTVFRLS
ncbi:glycosyltransferase [Brachybacterium tyrofermentans]|uniref:glycosyltransferase n=1 Tax=Brachybacterium tyrofermentans TaxID=47848 RepID=UPI003FCF85E2